MTGEEQMVEVENWHVSIMLLLTLGHVAALVLDAAYCYRCGMNCVPVGHNHELR